MRVSRSKPERGLVRYRMEVLNQRDEVVMTMTSTTIVRRRAGGGRLTAT